MAGERSTPSIHSDIIHRTHSTTDETPPWQGIAFILKVGTDKLADLLKEAYPSGQTLRERKHMAAIDFLKKELASMQSGNVESSSNSAVDDAEQLNSPASEDNDYLNEALNSTRQQSISSYTSHSAPSSIHSPGLVERSRQISNTTAAPQTFVFSAKDGKTMQPKTKRRMTKEERDAYKEVRKRGACEKCKRTKGRCRHVKDLAIEPFTLEAPKKKGAKRNSATLDQDHPESAKLPKSEAGSHIHYRKSEKARHEFPSMAIPQLPTGQLNSPQNSTEFSRTGSATGDGQWQRAVPEGQSEVYVHSPSEPLQEQQPHAHGGAGWCTFPSAGVIGQYNPVYTGEDPNLPRNEFPVPSPMNGHDDPYSYSDLSMFGQQWINGQDPQLGDAGPT